MSCCRTGRRGGGAAGSRSRGKRPDAVDVPTPPQPVCPAPCCCGWLPWVTCAAEQWNVSFRAWLLSFLVYFFTLVVGVSGGVGGRAEDVRLFLCPFRPLSVRFGFVYDLFGFS